MCQYILILLFILVVLISGVVSVFILVYYLRTFDVRLGKSLLGLSIGGRWVELLVAVLEELLRNRLGPDKLVVVVGVHGFSLCIFLLITGVVQLSM
jgi:hypothetical protein